MPTNTSTPPPPQLMDLAAVRGSQGFCCQTQTQSRSRSQSQSQSPSPALPIPGSLASLLYKSSLHDSSTISLLLSNYSFFPLTHLTTYAIIINKLFRQFHLSLHHLLYTHTHTINNILCNFGSYSSDGDFDHPPL